MDGTLHNAPHCILRDRATLFVVGSSRDQPHLTQNTYDSTPSSVSIIKVDVRDASKSLKGRS